MVSFEAFRTDRTRGVPGIITATRMGATQGVSTVNPMVNRSTLQTADNLQQSPLGQLLMVIEKVVQLLQLVLSLFLRGNNNPQPAAPGLPSVPNTGMTGTSQGRPHAVSTGVASAGGVKSVADTSGMASSAATGAKSASAVPNNRAPSIQDVRSSASMKRLAEEAQRVALNMSSNPSLSKSLLCLMGVQKALAAAGFTAESTPDGHAKYKAATLANSPNFKEIHIPPHARPEDIPAGTVLIWDPQNSGSGHATIALGNGMEASDRIQKLSLDIYNRNVRAFVPVV